MTETYVRGGLINLMADTTSDRLTTTYSNHQELDFQEGMKLDHSNTHKLLKY